jgi:Resolvase, N terminal domain
MDSVHFVLSRINTRAHTLRVGCRAARGPSAPAPQWFHVAVGISYINGVYPTYPPGGTGPEAPRLLMIDWMSAQISVHSIPVTMARSGLGVTVGELSCALSRSLGDPLWDTSSSQGRLLSTLLAAIADFERDLIRERTSEGRKRAMAAGVKFGRKRKLSDYQRAEAEAACCR